MKLWTQFSTCVFDVVAFQNDIICTRPKLVQTYRRMANIKKRKLEKSSFFRYMEYLLNSFFFMIEL